MKCDALLKGTQVDGVYSADPRKVADATRYDQLTYLDVLANDLGVMDAAAISLMGTTQPSITSQLACSNWIVVW